MLSLRPALATLGLASTLPAPCLRLGVYSCERLLPGNRSPVSVRRAQERASPFDRITGALGLG